MKRTIEFFEISRWLESGWKRKISFTLTSRSVPINYIDVDVVFSSLVKKKKRKNSKKASLGRNYLLPLPIKEAASLLSRCQTLAALRTKRMFVICTRDIVPLCLEFDISDWIFRAARVYSLEMDGRFGKLIDRFDARLTSETDTVWRGGSSFALVFVDSEFRIAKLKIGESRWNAVISR